jgi:hypothetical protein
MDFGSSIAKREASQKWSQARRRAFWTRLRSYLLREDTRLLDFDELSQRLKLRSSHYKGMQEVPLENIKGSVGRYRDFLKEFLPTTPQMEERWQKIAAMYLNPYGGSVPPIDVYKVGSNYFVRDGNHRVSVAKQLDLPTIEAYVWEYPITFADDTADIDTLLLEAEKQDFLRATELDHNVPDYDITLTVPGGHQEILKQIISYQEALGRIDGEMPTFEHAAVLWYEMVYEPTIQIIEKAGVLENFPGRTPADLFIWTRRRQSELEERYHHRIRMTEAVEAVNLDGESSSLWKRFWQRARTIFSR